MFVGHYGVSLAAQRTITALFAYGIFATLIALWEVRHPAPSRGAA